MQTRFIVSFVAASALAFAFAGCAAADGQAPVGEASEDLSSQHDSKLFGAFNYDVAGGPSMGFSHLVLLSDGTYFEDRPIYCITTPCNPIRATGIWSSTNYANTGRGQLTIQAKGEKSRNFQVSIAGDNTSMKLALTTTSTAALYDRANTFCDAAVDCAGQPVPALAQLCLIGNTRQTFCSDVSTCVSKCAPPPVKAECTTNADCRLFDDYCTGCDCRALSSSTADPKCSGPGVRCLREPCGGKSAACSAGKCVAN